MRKTQASWRSPEPHMSAETRSTRLQHMRRAAQAAPRHDERASRTSVTGGQVGWGGGGMGRKREVGGRPVRDRFEEEYIVWNYRAIGDGLEGKVINLKGKLRAAWL